MTALRLRLRGSDNQSSSEPCSFVLHLRPQPSLYLEFSLPNIAICSNPPRSSVNSGSISAIDASGGGLRITMVREILSKRCGVGCDFTGTVNAFRQVILKRQETTIPILTTQSFFPVEIISHNRPPRVAPASLLHGERDRTSTSTTSGSFTRQSKVAGKR
ncbi:uncharacterized protein ARMOST_19019 [Armillaria ostoyae]|uniref:Uncharacterized protein n=1 Tax=Armillaria ostoyae TaxID=47428 RepID=A0A284S3F6_ARMOS|nr:uncharacterized protein ARMOST_19019 [Armillaria ostoyae]